LSLLQLVDGDAQICDTMTSTIASYFQAFSGTLLEIETRTVQYLRQA
jgi:hypothetical protein